MIIDNIERAYVYEEISPAFAVAMKFLYEHKNGGLKEDKYIISDDAYALVKRYDSKEIENCKYEAHKNYIDVQYVASGDEYIGWATKKSITVDTYIEEKDQYHLSGNGELYPLHGGEFMILFPEDAHMPCIKNGKIMHIEKIILKIRVGR